MSTGPMNPNPYATPQMGGAPGSSPELMSKASTAFTMGIVSIVLGACCGCGLISVVLGLLSLNGANAVLAVAPVGSEAHAKASTAKILGIVGTVIGGLALCGGVVYTILQVVAAMAQH